MILQLEEQLEERIVRLLATNPNLRAKTIQEHLEENGHKYSIQGIYKELNKLVEEGVILKKRMKFTLSLPWVLRLAELTKKMEETHIEAQTSATLLTSRGRGMWHFASFANLESFWSHAVSAIVEKSKVDTMYSWIPCPWFHLIRDNSDDSFFRALAKNKTKLHSIIGGRSELHTMIKKYYPDDITTLSFDISPFERKRAEYIQVIGDFVVTARLNIEAADALDKLYEEVSALDENSIVSVFKVLSQPIRASLTIEKNSTKAERVRKTFEKFFNAI